MADTADLDVYQGDSYAATVTVLNADGTTPDLTGYLAQAQIRLTPHDPMLIDMTTVINLPNGITVTASSADTSLLQYERYVWDLQLTDTNNGITTILAGYVNVTPEVTR